jgi:hypothetical protein
VSEAKRSLNSRSENEASPPGHAARCAGIRSVPPHWDEVSITLSGIQTRVRLRELLSAGRGRALTSLALRRHKLGLESMA